MATLDLKYRSLILTVKFGQVLFPFDLVQFIRAVSNEGYLWPESFQIPPLGQRVEGRIMARKADISIRVDTERQLLSVHAPDIDGLIEEMRSVEALVKREFDLDGPSLAHYYEFLAGLAVKAKSNPLKNCYRHFGEVPIMKGFSSVLGEEISLFGIRLAAREVVPNQPNWFEFHFQPMVQSPTTHYLAEAIFRNSQRDEVFAFVRDFENTLRSLLSLIEKE